MESSEGPHSRSIVRCASQSGGTSAAPRNVAGASLEPSAAPVTAGARAAEHGIQEALLSFSDWRRIVAKAGFPRRSLVPYADTTYVPDPLFALAGRLVSRLPAPLRPELVPIGMMIVFDKQ